MFLMDRFFDGAFLTFGLEVIAFAEQDQEDRLDPLIYVFPRMTKVMLGFKTTQLREAFKKKIKKLKFFNSGLTPPPPIFGKS